MATITGDALNNELIDLSADALSDISGFDGNDRLFGGTGVDRIFGGLGDDLILGDTAIGSWLGAGVDGDSYHYENESFDSSQVFDDELNGDDGRDVIYGGYGDDTINGGDGDDSGYLTLDDGKVVQISLSGGPGTDVIHGGNGNDTCFGNYGNDIVYGDAGDDYLFGGNDEDQLFGGDGNDDLLGGTSAQTPDLGDALDGGDGFDTAIYFDCDAVTVSLDGSFAATGFASGDTFISIENLVGSKTGSDTLAGNAGENRIWSEGGNDEIFGRDGNDKLSGGAGDDRLFGEGGDDLIFGDLGSDILDGGEGIDLAEYIDSSGVHAGLDGSFSTTGDAAGDTFVSIENLSGSDIGNDILSGDEGRNTLWGNGGNDTLYGRDSNDWLYGYTGTDILFGGSGNDELEGGAGADKYYGGLGFDVASFYFSAGVSVSLDGSVAGTGEAKGDIFSSIEDMYGSNTGNDLLVGNAVNNHIYGNGGHDKLYGRAGNDNLYGYTGFDLIIGGEGNDLIAGGARADTLSGGNGADQYYYFDKTEFGDKIRDFTADDFFGFQASAFGLPKGQLAWWRFQSNSTGKAQDAGDRFIFRTTDDTLWYDADGTGRIAAVMVADIANDIKLGYSDILIV
jgi:Ca2+-binding RTX toxin-like protein